MGVGVKVAGLIVAFACVSIGFGFITGGPVLIRYVVQMKLPLIDPTRRVFKSWADANYDGSTITRKYFFWNITNPYEVHNDHEKPNLRRIGPFVYKEMMYKAPESIFWTPDGLISSTYHHDLFFDAESSVDESTGMPLDPKTTYVTNVNMPMTMLAHRIGEMPPDMDIFGLNLNKTVACDVVDLLMGSGGNIIGDSGTAALFSNRTPHELLFGYEDPLFVAFAALSDLDHYNAPTIFRFEFNASLPAPSPYNNTKGQKCPCWDDLSICNQTAMNPTKAYSGADWTGWQSAYTSAERSTDISGLDPSLSKLGSIEHWAGQDKMWWWGAGDCQKFDGSLATLFPPGLDDDSTPYVFVDAMYRKIKLQYSTDLKIDGITAKRFIVNSDELNFSANSKCYDQYFSGLFNLTSPLFGPIFTSGPFFFNMPTMQFLDKHAVYPMPVENRHVVNSTFEDLVTAGETAVIDGQPRQTKAPVFRTRSDWDVWTREHNDVSETFADIVPEAGVLLQGAARIQTNSWLHPVTIKDCPNVFKKMRPKHHATGGGVFKNESWTSYYPETLTPIFYLDREAVVSDSLKEYVRANLTTMKALALGLGIAFIIVGVGLAVATLIATCLFGCDGNKRKLAAGEGCTNGDGYEPLAHPDQDE